MSRSKKYCSRNRHSASLHRRGFLRMGAAASFASFALNSTIINSTTEIFAAEPAEKTPTTGNTDPKFEPIDKLMTSIIVENNIPGASLALTKNGKLVYARGFGYANLEKKEPVQPDSIFRIASISKPFTAVAVMQLAEQGKLKLEDKALDIVKLKPHLEKDAKPDPRWNQITIRQLLQHTGGWDRGVSYDPIARVRKIATSLGVSLPIGPEQIVRYMMGQPLDFDPGKRYAYSNLGYLVLGRVIETVAGEKYEAYVTNHILKPLGITRMRLGRARIENLVKGEVYYYSSHKNKPAIIGPTFGEMVPAQYGGENLEGYEAHGGWIASAIDLVKFGVAFDDPAKCPLLKEATIKEMWSRPDGLPGYDPKGNPLDLYYACGWNVRPDRQIGGLAAWHAGYISGTSTILVHRADGYNWAVLFNTDDAANGKAISSKLDPLVHAAVQEVKEWPTVNLFDNYYKKT